MTLPTAVPKPTPRTEADRRASRIASVQKLRCSQTPIQRSSPPSRSQPPRKRKPKPIPRSAIKKRRRPVAETARIYGPVEFRDYLHRHACLGCGYRGKPEQMQQAHVHTGGVGRKDDWQRTGPLCGPRVIYADPRPVTLVGCHHEQGNAKRSWRTSKGQTFAAAQREFFAEWEKSLGGARYRGEA